MKKIKNYSGIHLWLFKNYGKANQCQASLLGLVCKGVSKKFEWAKLKGKKYKYKRENFIQLCISCHKNYDYTLEWRKNLSNTHKGILNTKARLNPQIVKQIRELKNKIHSKEILKKFNLDYSHLSKIWKVKIWKEVI